MIMIVNPCTFDFSVFGVLAGMMTTKMRTGTQSKINFYQKCKSRRGKVKTYIQVQKSDFHDSAKVKRLRQIGAE